MTKKTAIIHMNYKNGYIARTVKYDGQIPDKIDAPFSVYVDGRKVGTAKSWTEGKRMINPELGLKKKRILSRKK